MSLTNRKPTLLIVTQWFHPGYRAGGPIRSTTNLVALLRDRFRIRVVTSDRDLGTDRPYPDLPSDRWIPYGSSGDVMYLSPPRQTYGNIGAILEQERSDCVYLNSMFLPRFGLLPLLHHWREAASHRMVIAPRGELLEGALQFKRLKKQMFLSTLRIAGILRGVEFHATDEQERRAIIARLGVEPSRVHVLANVPEPAVSSVAPITKRQGEVSLLFLSRIAAKKNLLFLVESLRGIPADLSIRLTIAGPVDDAKYWIRCQEAISRLPPHVAVHIVGAVSHDRVRQLMAEHQCFVLPTFGENYGHSIVEALGSGRPVIISDNTPWRGLESAGVGWDLPLDHAASFTTAIGTIAALDQVAYDRMATASWHYAKDVLSHGSLAEGYAALFGASP